MCFSFLFVSCAKGETSSYSIEGTWGLVYYNVTFQAGNELLDSTQGNCDPFNPTGTMNAKYSFINTNDSTYLLTEFSWNEKKKEWVFEKKGTFRLNDNKLTLVTIDGDSSGITATTVITIKSLTADTVVFERISTEVSDGVTYKIIGIYNMRRMTSI